MLDEPKQADLGTSDTDKNMSRKGSSMVTIKVRLRRRTFIGLVAVAAIIVVGVAVASWSTSTSGYGFAKAGTASALSLSDASAATVGDLYPGGSGTLKLKVGNSNSFPVRITVVSLTSGGAISSNIAACNNGGTGVSFTNQSGLSLDLAANAAATVFTLPGAVQMSNSSDNSCQGATFTIPVDVTAASN
jgi:hypothetical protein